ncbi:DUF6436 domain-containing protein [Pseudoalteromonas ulvae]|uniref:DUF6436 domain-containing protein n=1 Tax=Pseudoalteromonas ulvae TaxID=107327 RepID=UPI00186BA008|nr:DUF6436 domain-containing protein [Pseudoalteromonas ulvae]
MPVSNSSPTSHVTKHHYGLVVLWVLLTLSAATYFMSKKVVEFDPQGILALQSHQGIVAAILAEQNAREPEFSRAQRATLFHLSQAKCHCNVTSQSHIETLNTQAQALGMQIINLEITNNLKSVIPSTPATLIINNAGELAYLGPYGQGFACTEKTGVVSAVLNNLQKGFNSALVLNQAKGCYCATS